MHTTTTATATTGKGCDQQKGAKDVNVDEDVNVDIVDAAGRGGGSGFRLLRRCNRTTLLPFE